MPRRSYQQFCALGYGLDRVGDRWSLLIVRELLLGSARFGELHSSLSGIATNLLTNRLRELERDGLVVRAGSDSPTPGYELTAQGRALEPILREMAVWGMQYVDARRDGRAARPRTWLTLISLLAGGLRMDSADATLHLRVADLDGTVRVADSSARVVLGAPARFDASYRVDTEEIIALLAGGATAQSIVARSPAQPAGATRAFVELFDKLRESTAAYRQT